MSQATLSRWIPVAGLATLLLGGLGLIAWLGFCPVSTPVAGWRDHPFDLGNLQHLQDSLSLSTRLWAYDPHHLFGWTPHVFYNPLASLAGAVFLAPFGTSEGAYRIWLLGLLLASSLAFWPLMPRGRDGRSRSLAWVLGGLLAGWLSLLVYPQDVGLLDANPVQVLYTGQWAQRLGLALGLLCLERFWRALQAFDKDRRLAARRALVAAMLFGAVLFSHFMAGYACALSMLLLAGLWLTSGRLLGRGWKLVGLLLPLAVLAAAGLLFFDFVWVLLGLNQSHHGLPLLDWQVPEGALATVREVLLPALPLLLASLAGLLGPAGRDRAGFARAFYPLCVYLLILAAGPANLFWIALMAIAAALVAARFEGGLRARHWLPAIAFAILWLSCGPDSLRPFGLDLSSLLPFGGSIGWAKLAGFARFLLLAWLGVLAVEALGAEGASLARRLVVGGLALISLALPLALSLSDSGRTGAQTFFGWMRQTDLIAQQALIDRMARARADTPADGYLLVEDSLHHPEGSGLAGRHLPHGHLPYRVGPQTGLPVLGGEVTTRAITHPLSHTSRGQLLCRGFEELARDPDPTLERLERAGVAAVLAHSPMLIRALDASPRAQFFDRSEGMALYLLNGHAPILGDEQGRRLPGARLAFKPDGLELTLPLGQARARLRQVWYPLLDCEATGPSGPRACKLSSWSQGRETFAGCLIDDPRPVEVDVPWIELSVEPDPKGPVQVQIRSRPALWPFLLMIAAWLAAAWALVFGLRRR